MTEWLQGLSALFKVKTSEITNDFEVGGIRLPPNFAESPRGPHIRAGLFFRSFLRMKCHD